MPPPLLVNIFVFVSSSSVKTYGTIVEKAVFGSGKDGISTNTFSCLLQRREKYGVQPEDVALVRDPVRSDKIMFDTEANCWQHSKGKLCACTSGIFQDVSRIALFIIIG